MSNLLFQGLHLNTSLRESACAIGSRSDVGSDTGYSLYDHPHTHRAASIRLASQELSVTKWHLKLALGGEGLIRVTRSADATIILSDVPSSDLSSSSLVYLRGSPASPFRLRRRLGLHPVLRSEAAVKAVGAAPFCRARAEVVLAGAAVTHASRGSSA